LISSDRFGIKKGKEPRAKEKEPRKKKRFRSSRVRRGDRAMGRGGYWRV